MTTTKNGTRTNSRKTRRNRPQAKDATAKTASLPVFDDATRTAIKETATDLAAAVAPGMAALAAVGRQAWRDWLPAEAAEPAPDDLLTRDELIARLKDEGIQVSAYDLGNWQRAGAIPHGLRRWHDGAPAVLYPPGMVEVVRRVRDLQAQGHKLRHIGPQIRATAARDAAHVHGEDEATVARTLADIDDLLAPAIEASEAYARRYQERHGARLVPTAIAFRDEDGREYAYPLPPPE